MWKLLYSNRAGSSPKLWLRGTLANGQLFSFGCELVPESEGTVYEVWEGVLRGQVLRLKQAPFLPTDDELKPVYFWCQREENEQSCKQLLDVIFRSEVDLDSLYQTWGGSCQRFAQLVRPLQGIRLVDQEPCECLFSFICSTNNHIPRITQMLSKLREAYGEPIPGRPSRYKSFPTVDRLANLATEEALRSMGFGYRAKYIVETAKSLQAKLLADPFYISNLRDQSTSDLTVRRELQTFAGVGPKVADCVALFSCNRLSIVPVDVHVFALAQRDYDQHGTLLEYKSLNARAYDAVTGLFTKRFGPYAGWAHSILFTAELPQFQDRLSLALRERMKAFKHLRSKRVSKSSNDQDDSPERDQPASELKPAATTKRVKKS